MKSLLTASILVLLSLVHVPHAYAADLSVVWGASGDILMYADFDGDGKADVIAYRTLGTNAGHWYILKSSSGYTTYDDRAWGGATGELPLIGDVDGDGKPDMVIFEPGDSESSYWWILTSESSYESFGYVQGFGSTNDIPMLADFNDDGKKDFAVYRASNNTTYVHYSTF